MEKPKKMSKNHQKRHKTVKMIENHTKLSKNREKCRKTIKKQ